MMKPTTRLLAISLTCCFLAACSSSPPLTITVIGTNDVHGQLVADDDGRGGLVALSGYVNAVRDARQRDDGAVLLIDAGDMWQGTLESNISEGAVAVSIYNALSYTAAALGNHEFDFGPAGPAATPTSTNEDARGALKARLREAEFPMLAANLVDEETGTLVNWENVQPSVLINVSGVKVGIIGVMTSTALQQTIALNVQGLRVSPLAPAIEKQAAALRDAGATLIIVTAHAGGSCSEFDNPYDLSSCAETNEIFQVARALPAELVDHIIAGHHHEGIAHVVNGISITSSYSSARAFGRTDFYLNKRSGALLERKVYPPHAVIDDDKYEGSLLKPDPIIAAIAEGTVRDARASLDIELGIRLATPFTLQNNPESSLGNLFTDALLASADVDIALHNVEGGLRADLPAGNLTYGDVFAVTPFDNRVVIIELSGKQLRQMISEQAHYGHRSIGFSGMTVSVSCQRREMSIDMRLLSGEEISDSDTLRVLTNDYLTTGGDEILESVIPEEGFPIDNSLPMTRELFVSWLVKTGGVISDSEYLRGDKPSWTRPEAMDRNCTL